MPSLLKGSAQLCTWPKPQKCQQGHNYKGETKLWEMGTNILPLFLHLKQWINNTCLKFQYSFPSTLHIFWRSISIMHFSMQKYAQLPCWYCQWKKIKIYEHRVATMASYSYHILQKLVHACKNQHTSTLLHEYIYEMSTIFFKVMCQ
jgi:hypothetical protein